MTEIENENKLIELARKDFTTLTDTEIIFFRSVALSSHADYTKGGDNDPANASKWGEDRTIRASRISWLCMKPQAASLIGHQGIAVIGARIEENALSFDNMTLPPSCFTGFEKIIA